MQFSLGEGQMSHQALQVNSLPLISFFFLFKFGILYFWVIFHVCHFATGTPEFAQWGTIKDVSNLFFFRIFLYKEKWRALTIFSSLCIIFICAPFSLPSLEVMSSPLAAKQCTCLYLRLGALPAHELSKEARGSTTPYRSADIFFPPPRGAEHAAGSAEERDRAVRCSAACAPRAHDGGVRASRYR